MSSVLYLKPRERTITEVLDEWRYNTVLITIKQRMRIVTDGVVHYSRDELPVMGVVYSPVEALCGKKLRIERLPADQPECEECRLAHALLTI